MAVFKKLSLPAKDKAKWERVLESNMMSSEDSCSESDDVMIKKIPWRSQVVTNFMMKLDQKSSELKSPLGKRLRKERQLSESPSQRDIPLGIPKWAIDS